MTANNRPSLDDLVPLVMIEDDIENNNNNDDDLSCETQKGLNRSFVSIRNKKKFLQKFFVILNQVILFLFD